MKASGLSFEVGLRVCSASIGGFDPTVRSRAVSARTARPQRMSYMASTLPAEMRAVPNLLRCRGLARLLELPLLDPHGSLRKAEWPLGTATQGGGTGRTGYPGSRGNRRSSRPPFGYALLDPQVAREGEGRACERLAVPAEGRSRCRRVSGAAPRYRAMSPWYLDAGARQDLRVAIRSRLVSPQHPEQHEDQRERHEAYQHEYVRHRLRPCLFPYDHRCEATEKLARYQSPSQRASSYLPPRPRAPSSRATCGARDRRAHKGDESCPSGGEHFVHGDFA
jgi:hypothetical protein